MNAIRFAAAALLLGAALLFACTDKKTDPPADTAPASQSAAPVVDFVQFEIYRYDQDFGECPQDSARCARVSIGYPLAQTGPQQVMSQINTTLLRTVCSLIPTFEEENGGKVSVGTNIPRTAMKFGNAFEVLQKQAPEETLGWVVEIEGQVLFQNERVASIGFDCYSFTGGAHPNSFTQLLNFDLKTGKPLTWQDLLLDEEALKTLAESRFKQARKLPENADLTREGFFWDGAFVLPENFAFTEQGLLFHYNPYEVAAYALGPTRFTIPYAELEGLVRLEAVR